jgi:PEP-CTERM motif
MTNKRICVLLAVFGMVALCGQVMAHPGGANAPSSDLPPIIPEGYLSPSDVHAKYSGPALEIVLSMIEHQPYAAIPPSYFPDGERHHFESTLEGQVSVNNGPLQPIMMSGPVDTIALGRGPGALGTFDVEMLSMSLTGGPLMIRESPTRASTGKTSITQIGPSLYHIDSFFDVFTELSLDGGATWMPSNMGSDGQSHPTRVYLGGIPEPASIALLALGLVGIAGMIRRR